MTGTEIFILCYLGLGVIACIFPGGVGGRTLPCLPK